MTEPNWDLLDRYLAGQCAETELFEVERWLDQSPINRELVAQLRGAAQDCHAPDALLGRREAVWARLEREIAGRAGPRFALARRPRWSTLVRIAAAVLLTVAAAAGARLLLGPGAAPAEVAMRTVRTPAGQRASFQLPDGSQVILSPASTLRYPVDFTRGLRDVRLEGEAYFEVVHDEQRPFTVRAGDLLAKDLGTEFVVRAYPEDAHARVVVRAGKVSVRAAAAQSDTPTRVLAPGQLGRLSLQGEPIVEPGDTASWFAWTRGWLVFDGVPLRDAIPQLSRWYDLDFRLADSALGERLLVATLKNQPTDDALDVLALALGLRQVRRGRVVTFSAEKPQ